MYFYYVSQNEVVGTRVAGDSRGLLPVHRAAALYRHVAAACDKRNLRTTPPTGCVVMDERLNARWIPGAGGDRDSRPSRRGNNADRLLGKKRIKTRRVGRRRV